VSSAVIKVRLPLLPECRSENSNWNVALKVDDVIEVFGLNEVTQLYPKIIVISSLSLLLLALVRDWASPEKLFLGVVVVLILFRVLEPQVALLGLANIGVATIAALYVVVAGLRESGATQLLGRYLVGSPKSSRGALVKVLPVATGLSAVVNNTPVVAMFTSLLQMQSKRFPIKLSRVLMPLSYASILGGLCTLIGTSTNLVVDGLVRQQGYEGFALFELAWVGVPIVLVGWAYIALFGPSLLPLREGSMEQFDHVREYMVEMEVLVGCELVGKSIQDAGLRNLPGLFLVEIEREGQILSAVRPRTVVASGDRLVFAGSPESVLELRNIRGLKLANDQRFKLDGDRSDRRLFEAVLSPSNPMIGKTVRESRFRHRYSAVVLSVSRHGKRLGGRLGELVLEPGDTLLIEAQKGFLMRYRNSREFLLVSKLASSDGTDQKKATHALWIFITMISLSALGALSIFEAALLAASTMLVVGCISFEDAGKAIDYPVLLVIACAFALGRAVDQVGLADWVSNQLLTLADSPFGVLVSIYIATALLTELMTNNAAAIIMLPIGLATSTALGVSYEPFAIAVMVAASASFSTPTGYQTNLMVMGPGGYRYLDYMKFGVPLSILVAVVALAVIPRVWNL